MAHDIAPGKEHIIVNMQVALLTTCSCTAADGLNEFLRPEIGEGFIADYAFYNTDKPVIVVASDDPEEGELFIGAAQNSVCVVNVAPTYDCLAIVNGNLIMNTDGEEQFDLQDVFETAERMARALGVKLNVIEYTSDKPDVYFDDVMADLKAKKLI